MPSRSRTLLALLFFGTLFAALTAIGSAAERPDAANSLRRFWLVGSARTASAHSARTETATSQFHSLIEQVRFNQTPLPFEQGVTAGPGAGSLDIQFAAPASAADHLRYRLLGFDAQWKEAGKERQVSYNRLEPGHYEFEFEQVANAGRRGIVEQSIPITVIETYWQTKWLRSLSAMLLLLLVLALHKLRVRYLVRHAQRLQDTVNLTRAELTLAGKIADDAQAALKEQALKDGLTGLWNRRAISTMLESEVCRALRDRFPITLVMIDLDNFKSINDTYGHLTGDDVLREVAGRLLEVMRPYDFAGRYGGEEFLLILPSCSPHNGVRRAEDFRRAVAERPVPTAAGPLAVTCSLGVAVYDYVMPPEALIHRADEALYRAKRLGRNCVCAGS
ncbi:MAG TPA: GGDEF domain-containing protein [Acidobacteriaceae bacterium]|nr:GGDEF domain-containing protein [Acidobacteriaceae bacterium]